MNIQRLGKINLLLMLSVIFFSSCNLFFTSSNIRENIYDNKVQITGFTAAPSSDNSVVTLWNWNDASNNLDSDRRIDKIRIEHSITGYPELNLFFLGETFDTNSEWEMNWTDLIPGITHYFSLYAKDNRGNWYAPMYAKAKLPGIEYTETLGYADCLQVNTAGVTSTNSPTVTYGTACMVVELDIPDDVYIKSATITSGVGYAVETAVELYVYPVVGIWDQSTTNTEAYWYVSNSYTDYAPVTDYSVITIIPTTDPYVNDVTEVVRKAVIRHNKQIVFFASSGTDTLTIDSANFIDVIYVK